MVTVGVIRQILDRRPLTVPPPLAVIGKNGSPRTRLWFGFRLSERRGGFRLRTVTGRAAGVLVLVMVLAAACSGSPAAVRGRIGPAVQTTMHLQWIECGDGFQCAALAVPLDYSRPSGRKISLALIRKPTTDQSRRIGSLLINPGGPGDSGLDMLRGARSSLNYLNSFFDLVSWDPRGTGASSPVTCVDGSQLDSYLALDTVLDDPQEKQDFIQALKGFASGCAQRSGSLLPFVDTASTARDLDRIREAVGDKKLTYLGFSYGTYIGQWYAHLFPGRVRALALDGVVDSTEPEDQSLLHQVAGFQHNLDAFFAACKAEPRCAYGRSGDQQTKLQQAIERLDKQPLRVGDRELTRSLALGGVLVALYSENSWGYLDQALSALDQGDGSALLTLADYVDGRNRDGTYTSSANGASAATSCLDFSASSDIAAYDQLGPALVQASALFGPSVQYSGLGCAYWPVKGKHLNESLTIAGVPRILLVGATNDPATPYAEAQSVARQIPGSVLLTRDGYGHTSYALSRCVQSAEDTYLIDLTLPAPGTVCTH